MAKGTTKLEATDVLRACMRRWYVLLPILAITVWHAYGFYTSVKPVYYANAVVGVTGSNFQQVPYTRDGQGIPQNGLLAIGGADLIMNLVVLGFDDPAIKSRVVEGGGKGNFTVRMFPAPPSAAVQAALPLIMIEATEPDAESATNTVELAATQVDAILLQIQQQAGVLDSEMVRAIKASSPKAVVGMPSRNRSALLMLGLGTGLAVLAGVVVDVVINKLGRWRRKRQTSNLATSPTAGVHAKPPS